jgi:hypothetical protein
MLRFLVKFHNFEVSLTFHHVLDVAADGAHSGDFLLGSEPFLDEDLLTVHHANVHRKMTEIASQLSSWAANCDDSGIDFGGHALWDFNSLVAIDRSHFAVLKRKENKILSIKVFSGHGKNYFKVKASETIAKFPVKIVESQLNLSFKGRQ